MAGSGRSPLELLREHNREMRERLKRPKTPLDTLRLVNLRNRLRASRKGLLEDDVDNWLWSENNVAVGSDRKLLRGIEVDILPNTSSSRQSSL